MKLNVIGQGRFFRGFVDVFDDKPEQVNELLYQCVLKQLGLPPLNEMPRGTVVMCLQKGIVVGDNKVPATGHNTEEAPKTAIYIELTNVTDSPSRLSNRQNLLDGLVNFVVTVYKMAEYDHKAVQVKPEVLFVSPSVLIEYDMSEGCGVVSKLL